MPALPLTDEQLADASRLKSLYEQWKLQRKEEGQPASQMALGHALEINQSSISQYLNGTIPLNTAAAAKFAKVFGCQIDDFSPALAKEALGIGEAVSALVSDPSPVTLDLTSLTKLEMQLVLMFRQMPDAFKDEVLHLAQQLHTEANPVKSAANPFPAAPPLSRSAPSPAKEKALKRTTKKTGESQSH
ncbi:hypothetical protein [Comamonas odontotermitis]|uniref:hypothetical protein n=1 Tax=Comamonas odontotermitis TaxID=379895 RepID=UPI001CC5487C|nr:hypothetical protein [Comamonas odontotermitis]UBB16157.1 hypothetical protein LAD35_15195 [Comamonas odontotermitis]